MPELPEVQALVDDLDARLAGRAIARVEVAAFSALKTFDPPVSALHGLVVDGVRRHGKFLDVQASGVHLVMHLARGGWVRWRDQVPRTPLRPGKGPQAARVVLDDDTGFDVTEAGTQKRLALYVVHAPDQVPGIARLGPDPLDDEFTVQRLAAILAGAGRAQVKGTLRDQSVIAGIGNAYSDEALHAAKLSPYKASGSLTDAEVQSLHAAIRDVLGDAIARSQGLAASELKAEKKTGLRVHGRTGEECPVCGDTIREVSFADRAMQYCPTCQTGGKPLADRRMSRLLK
ncbi:MAG: Fpg/Nei family DNA glycosylase [Actinomycetota bacterium]|nr:Fpg/Nei family DNA glycosylase [Actinomycetota bacterium]